MDAGSTPTDWKRIGVFASKVESNSADVLSALHREYWTRTLCIRRKCGRCFGPSFMHMRAMIQPLFDYRKSIRINLRQYIMYYVCEGESDGHSTKDKCFGLGERKLVRGPSMNAVLMPLTVSIIDFPYHVDSQLDSR